MKNEISITWDKEHCWHPFTRQAEWTAPEHQPLMLVKGEGVWLWDDAGNRYIDGNASIWTNVHGHAHPSINAAIAHQLTQVAHTSYLGYAHPLAAELAARLTGFFPESSLRRCFYSDDGSTAVECAIKMAIQYRLQTGEPERCEFVAFTDAYHGDTMGAASLGGVNAFFSRFRKFGIPVHFVSDLDELRAMDRLGNIAGVVIEPLIQGVNQMHVWPQGMLAELRQFTEEQGIHLILDEVMTGFGRTGSMFACQQEHVVPDFLCLAKGLTGGYLPMAATLVREEIYEAFLGDAENAFYYGHSYTASQLGCAAALASLDVFEDEQTLTHLPEKIRHIADEAARLQSAFPSLQMHIRQCGMALGIELRREDGAEFPQQHRIGERICQHAREYGFLTRPILNTIVFMPPLCISAEEIRLSFHALHQSISRLVASF